MKNSGLKKITAFAAALSLAAQSSIAVINAKEAENSSVAPYVSLEDDPVYKCLIESGYTGGPLSTIETVELNGKYFNYEPATSIDILKKTSVSSIVLKDMKDFDLTMLKDLKGLKELEFSGIVNVKNIEALGDLKLEYIKVDTPADESEQYIKPADIYPYIKIQDITVAKGELKPLQTSPVIDPGYELDNLLYFKCKENDTAILNTNKWGDMPLDPIPSVEAYIKTAYVYGLSEGEITYTCVDAKGKTVGSAKITVTEPAEVDDPALIKNEVSPVKVLNLKPGNDLTPKMAYILYDNGSLYTFKDGTLKEYQQNIKDAALNGSDIYALSEDGVLYINGEAVNEKSEYTAVSGSKTLTCILCSDGCVRKISKEHIAEKILENIKDMDGCFGDNFIIAGIVVDEDDVTSIVHCNRKSGEYTKYPLEEKFKPVKIKFANPTSAGGLYSVYTSDNKIYEIDAHFSSDDAFIEVNPDVQDNNDTNDDYDLLNDMINYGNIELNWRDLKNFGNNKIGRVTSYNRIYNKKYGFRDTHAPIFSFIEYDDKGYYSVRDNEGTEYYDFVKNQKQLTHVKQNYGIYKLGNGEEFLLIQREDNTLWKYIIGTGELERIGEAITGSETLTGTEPEKAESKEGTPVGDVSGDGKVDVTDLTTISLTLLGDLNLTEAQSQVADINHNGKVDLSDLATMRQFLSKKIDTLG